MLEGGWWRGSLRDLIINILKQEMGKGKICLYWDWGFEGVTIPAPQKILIMHECKALGFMLNS